MANSVINTTAHTQQRPNRKSRKRKRKRLTETTGSSKPPKHVLADATSSKRRQPYPLIPTPPLTEELTPRKAADTVSHSEPYNCDHIWDLIQELKAKQYPSNLCLANLCPATMNTKDDSTIITIKTTTTQPRKEELLFAEVMLHPRWIAVRRERVRNAKSLSTIQEAVRDASNGKQSLDFKSIIGRELFANLDEGHEVVMKKLRFLRKSQASEPQWEARFWRRWFLKDSIQDPDDRLITKPFMSQIVQAKMLLSSRVGVLPPLLALTDDRRESGLVVARIPWSPNLLKRKGNHVLWYPDYLYAVSQSSLPPQIQDFDVDELPAFRLAQYKHLPANWIAEIKSEDTDANHLAAEHYSAFLSAYLLHERLLLHWIAENGSIKSNNPVKFNNDLAVYCITCCGPACRIWRMSIRMKEDVNSDLEPVRYDMQLLDNLDLEEGDDDQRLCDWINALNALALTVQLEGIITDLKGIQNKESSLPPEIPQTYSWTSKVGFVYKAGSTTEICVASLDKLRKAYYDGDITADEPIGDKVVVEWDEMGQPMEVSITRKGEQVPEPVASFALPGAPPAQPGAPPVLPDAPPALPVPTALPVLTALPVPTALPGAPSLPSAPPAGNAPMTQFTEAMLRQFSSSGVRRIAQALFDHVNPGGEIGSTMEGYIAYITKAQQASVAGGMRMDIWKDMGLSKGDLNKLRVETLRTIFNSIGAGDPGSTATKRALVEALSKK